LDQHGSESDLINSIVISRLNESYLMSHHFVSWSTSALICLYSLPARQTTEAHLFSAEKNPQDCNFFLFCFHYTVIMYSFLWFPFSDSKNGNSVISTCYWRLHREGM